MVALTSHAWKKELELHCYMVTTYTLYLPTFSVVIVCFRVAIMSQYKYDNDNDFHRMYCPGFTDEQLQKMAKKQCGMFLYVFE